MATEKKGPQEPLHDPRGHIKCPACGGTDVRIQRVMTRLGDYHIDVWMRCVRSNCGAELSLGIDGHDMYSPGPPDGWVGPPYATIKVVRIDGHVSF